jgi:hypothetical protein
MPTGCSEGIPFCTSGDTLRGPEVHLRSRKGRSVILFWIGVSLSHSSGPPPPRGSATRVPPRQLEIVRDPFEQPQGDLLRVGRLAEQQEGGERLLVDIPRLEDRHHLRRDPFELGRPPLPQVDCGEIERDPRGVEADPPLELRSLIPGLPGRFLLTQ